MEKSSFILFVIFVALMLIIPGESVSELAKNVRVVDASDSVALENGYVTVMHNIAVCLKAYTPKYGTRVLVALTELKIQSSKGSTVMQRGEIAVFLIGESYTIVSGEFFEVAFKLDHPPLKAPERWIEPLKNTIIYSDDQFRVFQEQLAPGDERELHSHAQRIVVRLNAARLTDPRFHEPGSTKGSLQVPNTVKFAEPIVHVVRNVSEVPLFNIVIEFIVPH